VAVATVQFSRAAERALGRPADTKVARRAPVSQNSTACPAFELGVMPRGARAPRPPAEAGDG